MPQAGAKCLIDGDEPAFAVLEEHTLREVIEKSLFRRRGCGRGDDGGHETIPLKETSKNWRNRRTVGSPKSGGMRFCPAASGRGGAKAIGGYLTRIARIFSQCKQFGIPLPIIVAMA